jgi:hypothetical protein
MLCRFLVPGCGGEGLRLRLEHMTKVLIRLEDDHQRIEAAPTSGVSITVLLAQLEFANPRQPSSSILEDNECLDSETVTTIVYSEFAGIIQSSVIIVQ